MASIHFDAECRQEQFIGVGYIRTNLASDSTKTAFVQRVDGAARLATINVDGSINDVVSADDELLVDSPQSPRYAHECDDPVRA